MSKKKWIISGGVIVALVAATIVGRQLTGKIQQVQIVHQKALKK